MEVLEQRGRFGIGIFHSKFPQNIGTLFRSAESFGAAYVFTIGERYSRQRTETTAPDREAELLFFDSLRELRKAFKKATLVAVELAPSAVDLALYEHPDDACYLLGSEDSGLPRDVIAACDDVVQIPHVRRSLNVAAAGSIVLYDRIAKAARPGT
jgi:tRNA (guanosine-2'-O-)-methyltransferase